MLIFIFICFLALRFWFWFGAFPNYDEAYYWLWSQYPALSYFDHPPLLAWATRIATWIFGSNLFSLRLVNAMTSVGVVGVLGVLLRHYYSGRFVDSRASFSRDGGWLLPTVLVFFGSPLFFNFFAIAWNDSLMLLFGLLSTYAFSRLLEELDRLQGQCPMTGTVDPWTFSCTRWLFLSATALGLAALAKYNACFFAFGFFLTLLSKKKYRRIFFNPLLFGAAFWALFLFSPVLIWNGQHHFESFRFHLLSRHASVSGFSWSHLFNFRTFVIASILSFSPVLFFLAFRWIFFRKNKQFENPYERVAFWTALSSTVPLLVLSLNTYVAYHWNITAALVLLPILISQITQEPRRISLWVHSIYGLLMALGIVVNSAALPLEALTSRDRDPHSRMLYGWKEVGEAVTKLRSEPSHVSATLGDPLIVTTDYGLASALAFQLRDVGVFPVSERRTEFDRWMPHGELRWGRDAILVWDDWHPLSQELRGQFERVEEPRAIPIFRWGRPVKTYSVAWARGWHP